MATENKATQANKSLVRRTRASLIWTFSTLALFAQSACGETGDNATTNVQGGAARAPGAPPPKP